MNIINIKNCKTSFLRGTPIETDQGEIPIHKLTNKNSINGQRVIKIIKSKMLDGNIILISKNSIDDNIPSRDTYISLEHNIYIKDKTIVAKNLINCDNIKLQFIGKQNLYNVLLKNHSKMKIYNMEVETMNPENLIFN